MLSLREVQDLMTELDDWSLDSTSISRVFYFTSFKESLDFVNKVGEIAEKSSHHPDILINHNTVRLILTTHSEKGLTVLDFNLAKEIDKLN